MAEDAVDQAAMLAGVEVERCVTRDLQLHGYHLHAEQFDDLAIYGSDAPAIQDLLRDDPLYAERVHKDESYRVGEVVWSVRHEMARIVEDILARRTRLLLLDARRSIEMAPKVAEIMAEELGRDIAWQRDQVAVYTGLARGYIIDG